MDAENNLLLDKVRGKQEASLDNEVDNSSSADTSRLYLPSSVSLIKQKTDQATSRFQDALIPFQSSDLLQCAIPLKDGRKAILYYPEDVTNDDLNKITRFIEALRE